MTIYPANYYTRDHQMRERGTYVYRQFRQLTEQLGEAEAFNRVGSAPDFVAANYTSGAIVIGASASTGTGNVQTASTGVDFRQPGVAAAWGAFIDGKGPVPAGAPLPSRQTGPAASEALKLALQLPPDAAASLVMSSTKLVVPDDFPLCYFNEFSKLADQIPGGWSRVDSPGQTLILVKEQAGNSARIVVDPSQGISLRAEVDKVGAAVGVQPPKPDGTLVVTAAPLELEEDAVARRYVPRESSERWVSRPAGFLL